MRVSPGDTMFASVTVSGQRATLVLEDQTRHTTFRKTLRVSPIDLSSAEWIVEAPSECVSANTCQTLPLADFGSATFALAGTQTTSGRNGSISDRSWDTTKIKLSPSGRRFVAQRRRRERWRRDPVRAEQRRQRVQGHVPDRLDSGEPDRARGRGGGARRLHRARAPAADRGSGSARRLRRSS